MSETTFGYTVFPEHDEISTDELARNQRDKAGYKLSQFVPSANPLNILPAATFGGVPNAANLAVEQRLPQAAEQSTLNLTGTLTYNLSSHLLKAGIYIDRLPRQSYIPLPFNGSLDFSRNVSNPLDTGYAYANAALGVFSSYTEASKRVWYDIRAHNVGVVPAGHLEGDTPPDAGPWHSLLCHLAAVRSQRPGVRLHPQPLRSEAERAVALAGARERRARGAEPRHRGDLPGGHDRRHRPAAIPTTAW